MLKCFGGVVVAAALATMAAGCGEASDYSFAGQDAGAEIFSDAAVVTACLDVGGLCAVRGDDRECCPGLVCKYAPKIIMSCQPAPVE